ncbi:hypothetical protein C8Q75DRAFT_891800 [Abortiporus biennis]|nr:hypothetical protein C8Q75DRAFT_891800 [Abortiporus biennis]
MSTVDDEPLDETKLAELVESLNDLLANLHLPLSVDTPLDLTPSLLIGILESILCSRLPISQDIRVSKDALSKVQAMKVFIGVLENDIIGEDVGLGEVDPRKLAEGEWDEVVFVGELLVWLGKKFGFLPITPPTPTPNQTEQTDPLPDLSFGEDTEVLPTEVDTFMRNNAPSPSTHSTLTTRNSMNTTLSLSRNAPPPSTNTTISIPPQSPPLSDLDLFGRASPIRTRRPIHDPAFSDAPIASGSTSSRGSSNRGRRTPRCIHEVGEPSFSNLQGHSTSIDLSIGDLNHSDAEEEKCCICSKHSESATSKSGSTRSTPVRYDGWISQVDDDMEIKAFEARRSARSRISSSRSPPTNNTISHLSAKYSGLSVSDSRIHRPRTPPPAAQMRSSSLHSSVGEGAHRSTGIITRHTSPSQYTLALLNERARLMSELAQLRMEKPK